MGTMQTLDVLRSYASLLSGSRDSAGAEAVRALFGALSTAEGKTIKATVAKVTKSWSATPQAAASPAGLSPRLKALHSLLAAAGAKAVSTDVGLLADFLNNREAVESGVFERVLREAISAPVAKAAIKRKPPARVPLSDAEARAWGDRLTAVCADQNSFEAELSALTAVPKLSVTELRSVAEHYLGHGVKGTKDKILKALRTRQKQDAIEASRQGRLSRIAV